MNAKEAKEFISKSGIYTSIGCHTCGKTTTPVFRQFGNNKHIYFDFHCPKCNKSSGTLEVCLDEVKPVQPEPKVWTAGEALNSLEARFDALENRVHLVMKPHVDQLRSQVKDLTEWRGDHRVYHKLKASEE